MTVCEKCGEGEATGSLYIGDKDVCVSCWFLHNSLESMKKEVDTNGDTR